MPDQIDALDARILALIQEDAGLSVAEVAERVGLSSSPCWRRIKRMEEAGVIEGRATLLNREKLGLGFEVYATLKLSLPTKENLDAFEAAISRWPEVVQCATVTGEADYVLRIITRDIAPMVFPTIRTLAMLEVATVILAAASLTFLGIGLQRPDVDWGMMVADGKDYLKTAWFVTVIPGVVIVLTALSANIISNWLRAVEDPTQNTLFIRRPRGSKS